MTAQPTAVVPLFSASLVILPAMLVLKLGIVFPILLAAGCTSSGPVRSLVVASNNTADIDRNPSGTVTLRSLRTHIVSVFPPPGRFSDDTRTLPSFYVVVTNGSQENLKFKPDDIRAYSGDRSVALLDPVALQDRLDREQAASGSTDNLPITMRDASRPGELTHEELRRLDPSRMQPRSELGQNYPQDTRVATAGSGYPKIDPFGAPKFQVPARIVETALQPQVIRPGEVGGGRIVLEAQNILAGLPLKIVVNVAGEKHEFLFDVR